MFHETPNTRQLEFLREAKDYMDNALKLIESENGSALVTTDETPYCQTVRAD